ncbi:MAG: glycosyltransferase family 2 protein [Patescibacteria group bacterium]|jgi:GT2 family glycosyltransferase
MKLSIGIITYNQSTYKYLNLFLFSLSEAIEKARISNPDLEIFFLAVDNSDSDFNSNHNYLIDYQKDKPGKIWRSDMNLGFSKPYNCMMNWSIEQGSNLFLMLNPDVLLDIDFIANLVQKYKADETIAILVPKIFYWDFSNNVKTTIIDSCGVGLNKAHRFFDIGQGQSGENRFLLEEEVFGFSGAGALLNLNILKKVAYSFDNYYQFFDERMFMYKEDVDLSYRLQLLGAKILFLPEAKMYHHRTLSSYRQKLINKVRQKKIISDYSALNQFIILFKSKNLSFSPKIKLLTAGRYIILWFFALIFSRKVFQEAMGLRAEIIKKSPYLAENRGIIDKIEGFMDRY